MSILSQSDSIVQGFTQGIREFFALNGRDTHHGAFNDLVFNDCHNDPSRSEITLFIHCTSPDGVGILPLAWHTIRPIGGEFPRDAFEIRRRYM